MALLRVLEFGAVLICPRGFGLREGSCEVQVCSPMAILVLWMDAQQVAVLFHGRLAGNLTAVAGFGR